MMKKVLYSIVAIATLALAAGCQKEAPVAKTDPGTAVARFSVSLPQAFATKAVSDGRSAQKLFFYVYDETGANLAGLNVTDKEFVDKKVSFDVNLVAGMKYSFAFIAYDASALSAYTIDKDSKTLTIDYTKLSANNDSYDVFTASVENYVVTGDFTKDVKLIRPMAQVNVGSPDADWAVAETSGIQLNDIQTSLKFSKLGTGFNFLKGEVDETAVANEVTIPAATRPSGKLTVNGTAYNYVAMAYVLVPGNASETVDVALDVTGLKNAAGAALSSLHRNVPNVPIHKNYRTNILGNIFSAAGHLDVEIDNEFQNPDYVVSLASQAALDETVAQINAGSFTGTKLDLSAAEEGTVLDFSGLSAPLTIPVEVSGDKTVVIENLKAGTTTGSTPAITIAGGSKAIIEGADLTANTSSDGRAINVNAGSVVTIRNSKIDANYDKAYSRGINILGEGSTITVEDSEISGKYALNLVGSATNNTIKVENTTLDGWAIINIWNDGNSFEFSNCKLNSRNKYRGETNAFAAIVFNGKSNNTITVTDSEITVTASGDQPQYLVGISGTGNIIYVKGNTVITGTNTLTETYAAYFADGITEDDYLIDLDETVSLTWSRE